MQSTNIPYNNENRNKNNNVQYQHVNVQQNQQNAQHLYQIQQQCMQPQQQPQQQQPQQQPQSDVISPNDLEKQRIDAEKQRNGGYIHANTYYWFRQHRYQLFTKMMAFPTIWIVAISPNHYNDKRYCDLIVRLNEAAFHKHVFLITQIYDTMTLNCFEYIATRFHKRIVIFRSPNITINNVNNLVINVVPI